MVIPPKVLGSYFVDEKGSGQIYTHLIFSAEDIFNKAELYRFLTDRYHN
jgi:hypothetical protein